MRTRTWFYCLAHGVLLLGFAVAADDPFADLSPVPMAEADTPEVRDSWSDNLLWRRELYLLLGAGRGTFSGRRGLMSRSSAGFEVQKRFSSATRTLAMIDYQGRMVYRDRPLATAADTMGHGSNPWSYETHNAYLDLYNLLGEPGRLNLRLGNFYQPFGLAQQTDTHATLLQLSNERLLGSAHDWQGALYGNLSDGLDYALAYLLGSGHDHKWDGQSGMGALRVMLDNSWLFEHGLEGGVSGLVGERYDPQAARRLDGSGSKVVSGWRAGADLRKRFDSLWGPFTLGGEGAGGADRDIPLLSGLMRLEWLNPVRRWGSALQYQHFWQEGVSGRGDFHDIRYSATLTRYFKNEIGSANLHWIALALERVTRNMEEDSDTFLMLQYYRYW